MMSKKTVEIVTVIGIWLVSIASVVFLIVVLDKAFSGMGYSTVRPQAKKGTSIFEQSNADGAASSNDYASPSSQTTPDNGLPFIAGFNTGMTLERISIWWDGAEKEGRASSDLYLRAAVRSICKLEEELDDYVPPEDAEILRFKTTYNGMFEQEVTIFPGNIAEFAGLEGRYFQIPDVAAVARGMLAMRGGVPEKSPQTQMHNSAIMACFTTESGKVVLDSEKVKAVAEAYSYLDMTAAVRPEELPAKKMSLVFYYYGIKNYVDIFANGLVRYNNNNKLDVWYTASTDALDSFRRLAEE